MAKAKGAYTGFSRLASIIIAIIFVLALIFGIIQRIKEGKILAAIIRIFFGWNIVWILDLIFVIANNKIFELKPIL